MGAFGMTPKARKQSAVFQEVPGYPELELDTRSGIFYVRKSVLGKGELFRSTRCRQKKRAQTIAQEMISEFTTRKPGLRSRRVRISDLCDALFTELEIESKTVGQDGLILRKPRTFAKDRLFLLDRTYRGKAREAVIKKHFGEYFADEIDEQFWNRWVKKEGRRLGTTLGDITKYLSHVLDYAFMEKYIGRKPRLKSPDAEKNDALVYDNEQIVTFYLNAEPLLQDLIVLASENPLRPHENCEVEWSMVDFQDDGSVIYRLPASFTKTRTAREFHLSPRSALILRRRRQEASGSARYVFPSPGSPEKPLSRKHLSGMWRRMKLKAGITGPAKFHWLRHSFYSKAILEAMIPIATAGQAGGTSAKTLEKRYLKSTAEKTRAVSTAVSIDFEKGGRK
jgi:integrase